MLEGLVRQALDELFDRIAKMQSAKHLFMVDGFSLLRMGAIGERARTGQPLSEPYGSTRRFLDFNELMFLPVQLSRFPLDKHQDVKTEVVIGRHAARPLRVSTPIMITGMAFGSALSKRAKIAVAKASALAGTATNSGESGFMAEEREAARKYIVQWNRGRWSNRLEDLRHVDAVEIQVGQGAEGSLGNRVKAENIREDFRAHLGLEPGQDAVRPARFRHIDDPSQFRAMVDELREASGGAPVGIKFAASRIEEDCEVAIQAGVDFITIDGAQGGSGGGREVTINNTGVPLVYAIPRANRYLHERGVRDRIDLIVTGGLRDAGDFMKAMALGANAVYIGESALLAMIYHQLDKMPPATNPAQLFLYTGEYQDQLDIDQGAQHLANFIKASTTEMQLLAQTLGKNDLQLVNMDDMVALSREMAEITGVQLAYMPQEIRTPPVPVMANGQI
ncbi:MAG TPA: FMN-binding glutamate synthase family protein [Limnochordales bacterium]|nr:FMN-binding glutamate synthase family protein [Limnochordales bacterium]